MCSAPTYFTRSKHGVYYFQVRISTVQQIRLNTKSKLYRKSLKTKDRKLAINLARRMWVHFNHTMLRGARMSKKGSITGDVLKWLEQESLLAEQARDKSKHIKSAISFEVRLNAIPDWDEESIDDLWEHITQEEKLALKYVTDNAINLAEYRDKPVKTITAIDQTNADSIKLSDALEKYLAVKKTNNASSGTLKSYRDNISLFIEIVNIENTGMLTREHVNEYINAIQRIPTNRKKVREFRDKSLAEILDMDIDENKLLSSSTVSAHATNVKAFLDWGIKNEHVREKVTIPLEDAFKNPTSHPYLAFTAEDLKLLFNSNDYIRGTHKTASHFWVPLIGLYTGGRANEICQLYVADIKTFEGSDASKSILYFDFNDEGDKTLKTTSSKRKIPVHQALLKLGFLSFVDNQKQKDHIRLFDDLKEKNGKYSNDFSRWFNNVYRPGCGIESLKPDKRKVFQSFRHTLTQNIRRNNKKILLDKIAEIIGHTNSTTIGKHYAGTLDLEDKLEVIETAKYDIDIKNIRRWKR